MKPLLFGAIAAAALLACGSAASATTIVDNFTFQAGTDPGAVATGSFSYSSTNSDATTSGQLTFADLESFQVKLYGETFTLPFVNSLISSPTSAQDDIYFGYDTKTNTFNPGSTPDGEALIAALSGSGSTPASTGFFFDPTTSQGGDGLFGAYPGPTAYTTPATFSITSRVPEPSTWAMMILGLAGLGAMMRVLRRKSGAAWAASQA